MALRRQPAGIQGELARALWESCADAILVIDEASVIRYANPAVHAVFGYAPEEVLGRNLALLQPAWLAGRHREAMVRYVQTGVRSIDWRAVRTAGRRKDGAEIPIDVSFSELRLGGRRHFAGFIKDVSARERLVREREALLARMQMQLERMPLACVLFDAELLITYANPAAERTFGWRAAEMRGRRALDLYVPPERRALVADIFARLRRGEYVAAAGESVRKDGSRVVLEWVNTPLMGRDGAFLGLMSMANDVTERLAAEARLEALTRELEQRVEQRTAELAAANQELEAFSYSVSHDLRAPVRHIDGFARLLAKELAPTGGKVAHYLDTISAAARRMGTLIDDLLQLSRTGRLPLKLERVELAPLAREVMRDAAPEIGQRRVEWAVGELPAVMADPALLRIVLQNLVSNALKYTRPRAVARIALEARAVGGGIAEITVRDNGVGFDARFKDKLFGVFQRLHREEEFEGTGVGLATARRIVHRHGQRIWAEGEPDRGAAFTFTLAQCETEVVT